MRNFGLVALLLCSFTVAFAADDDPNVRRAAAELEKIRGLVSTGVLPRARLDQAQEALSSAQEELAIRNALYIKDITVEQADSLVALTQKRLERCQKAVDDRNKLLAQGIIARSELGDAEAAFDRAKQDRQWAETRSHLARDLAELAKNEQEIMRQMELAAAGRPSTAAVEHFVGSNRFEITQFALIEKAFEKQFARPLPVSAMGETEVHKSLGFDHRNRIDVALPPDDAEGQWLRTYLTSHNIPYFAFRSAVAHKATGAHIHIGPPSLHYVAQTVHRQPKHVAD